MMNITITIPDDIVRDGNTKQFLSSALAALGYAPTLPLPLDPASDAERVAIWEAEMAEYKQAVTRAETDVAAVKAEAPLFPEAAPAAGGETPKRERGKAAPGRQRRSKQEIAEDEAADAADAAAAAARGNISTNPEDRQPPEDDETVSSEVDDAETTAQDEADEAAEQATRMPEGITLDTLRGLITAIGKKHGMPVALKVPKFLGSALAEIPESSYPDVIETMQGMLDADTADLKAMLTDGSEPAAKTATPATSTAKATDTAPQSSAPKATREDLLKAMYRYAKYADNTDDQSKMSNTMVDLQLLFREKFKVESQRDIKETDLGAAIAAVDEAIQTNRFKRG